MISPESTSPYRPIFVSVASGLFDFSGAEEPVVDYIDFVQRVCFRSPAFASLVDQEFEVQYDSFAITPGHTSQTSGTSGVIENPLSVKNFCDAMAVHQCTSGVLEITSLPCKSPHEQEDVPHIIGKS